jgi:polysaccharide biosynthesis transport protein
LALTSVLSGDEKLMLILGLALSAARLNHRVLVLDADMQCPRLHLILDLANDRGLFDLLTNGSSSLPEKFAQTWQPMVDVLTAGEPTGDVIRFLRMNQLQDILRSLENRYDLILINTPPSLDLIDASFVAECCQGLILLVPMGRTKRPELMQTLEMLELSNIRGIVTAS